MVVASRNYADFASEATFEIKVKQLNTGVLCKCLL